SVGSSIPARGAAPLPGYKEEENEGRSLPTVQGRSGDRSADICRSRDRSTDRYRSGDRSADRYHSGDRLGDPARDRSTVDRSRGRDRAASRERSTALDRPTLSVGLNQRSEDRSAEYSRSGNRLGDRFADRSEDVVDRSRRREGPASRERAALDPLALSIGSRKRFADQIRDRSQDRVKDRSGDRYHSGDRSGERYASRSDDRSFRRQDRPASRERTTVDRSARRSQYVSHGHCGDRSRDDSTDRSSGAPGSRARFGVAAPRGPDRTASDGNGGGGGGGGWNKGNTREQERGRGRLARDDKP
ncbi:unnamed protein product, partial [Laminaria digitata]